MDKERAKRIVQEDIKTLIIVQGGIIRDERAAEILTGQLETLQKNIFEHFDKESA